jgi:Tfp pilus assembly PilM family ATPase
MASQTLAAPKQATKPTTKVARSAQKKSAVITNGHQRATRTKPTSEMTLEELSLRAYKMTYERLHGSKKKQK